jgi:multidrug resistance efflux pump
VFTHTRLCGEQVKVQELQGAIRDTSATLQDVEAQLEKAKADLLEHEADYLLRQIAAEHVDEVARKQVTEVSAAPAPAPATLSSLRAKCSGRGARPWR